MEKTLGQPRKPHGELFRLSWGEGGSTFSCFILLFKSDLVIGGQFRGNLGKLQGQSKVISNRPFQVSLNIFVDIRLVDPGSIQVSAGPFVSSLECSGHGMGGEEGFRAACRMTCASAFKNGFLVLLEARFRQGLIGRAKTPAVPPTMIVFELP